MTTLLVGLVLFGISLALLVTAGLGLDPWDVFHQGVSRTIDVRLGAVVVVTSLAVMLLWIPLGLRIGLGTLFNAVVVGVVFEAAIGVLPEVSGVVARSATLVLAIVGNAAATGLYIGAGLGPGPRDGLMTGLAARGWTIRRVRTAIEVTVLAIGWLLGGDVGVGTVLFAVAIGPLVHIMLPLFAVEAKPELVS